ncbi:hypothetical protein [Glutamicibacter arilaitensis]|uniref:hypothetical protein n=1 Tax=Glutamicibacter arilaitensis TaxID=256701 RepID=UPI003A93CA64
MRYRAIASAAVVAAGVVALAGCSNSAGIEALDRSATEADQWPGSDEQLEDLDAQTVRKLLSHENADYFVVSAEDQRIACLFKFSAGGEDTQGVGGCGGAGGADTIVEVTADKTQMTLVRAGADTSELEAAGWTRIHENVLIF